MDQQQPTDAAEVILKQTFDWPDYTVFSIMLLVCIFIGIYFGFFHVSKNVTDYLVGTQDMSVWPVSVSLVVSYLSGISLMGIPTEMYVYGVQFLYILLDCVGLYIVGTKLYLPVFMELKLTSTYEYLERRFDKKLRRLGSIMFIIGLLIWLPIVVYVPAIALNHATDLNTHLIIFITSGVCIFYTCIGGIRAVIWTDFLQAFLMVGSVMLVAVKGTREIGGIGVVVERNWETSRLEAPDMDFDLTKRLSFFPMLVGGTFGVLSSSVMSQMMMQRYVSLPSVKHAGQALWLFTMIKTVFILVVAYTGLLIFATYHNCDPLSTKTVQKPDQLLPLLVIDTLNGIPGAAGLFLAGIFSASLSSLSSGLNCLAAIILEDCYKPMFKKVSEKEADYVVKSTVLIVGAFTIALTYVVEQLGAVLQLSASLGSIASGPVLGMFTLGVLFPWVNTKGAFYGSLGGLAFMSWIIVGNQVSIAHGAIQYPKKPVFVDGCTFNTTLPGTNSTDFSNSDVFVMYRLSFVLYTMIGTMVTIILSLIVSYFTGFNKVEDVEPAYLAPCIRNLVKSKSKSNGTTYIFPEKKTIGGQTYEVGELVEIVKD